MLVSGFKARATADKEMVQPGCDTARRKGLFQEARWERNAKARDGVEMGRKGVAAQRAHNALNLGHFRRKLGLFRRTTLPRRAPTALYYSTLAGAAS